MYKNLDLTLSNNKDLITLTFDVYQNDISQSWAKEINQNYNIYESDRFKGWPNKNQEYYKENLKIQIDTVNKHSPKTINNIDIKNQEDLNYLHKFFENLRGHIETGTDFYNTSPIHVKQAIDRFNVLIHEYEHFLRDSGYPSIVVTFEDRPRYPLEEQDYQEFTFKWKFGEIYINYCEVGKPLLDVYKDRDSIVDIDNIRPLEYYSADFMIKFGPSTTVETFYKKLEDFNSWYKSTGLKFENLSLGLIPVAMFNILESGFDNYTEEEIIETIEKYNKVKSVCIK
jgi:hypothetical protein